MRFGTVNDAAEILGIKPDTAYRWAWDGYLPCIRLGRSKSKRVLRFNLEAVRKWAEDQGHAGRTERVPHVEVGR